MKIKMICSFVYVYMLCLALWYWKAPHIHVEYTKYELAWTWFNYITMDLFILLLGVSFLILIKNINIKHTFTTLIFYQSIVVLYDFYLITRTTIQFDYLCNSSTLSYILYGIIIISLIVPYCISLYKRIILD